MSNYNSGYADSSMSVSVDKVLRNTYLLLSMTLLFSAFVSYMTMGISPIAGLICMLVAFGVLFLLKATCESAAGIPVMFLFTGLLGAGIAPTINHYAVNVGAGCDLSGAGRNRLYFLYTVGLRADDKERFFLHGRISLYWFVSYGRGRYCEYFLCNPRSESCPERSRCPDFLRLHSV